MRVDGTSHGSNADVVARLQEQINARGAARPASSRESGENESLESPAVEAAEGEGGGQGAIRLLQEGHFRGVADVRLRINFADKIQGTEASNVGAALKEGLGALQKDLNSVIDALASSGALGSTDLSTLRAAQDTFNSQVDTLLGSDARPDEVFGKFRTAFEDFLKGLVPPQANNEESVSGAESVEVVEESSTTDTSPLDSTTNAPADPLAGLRDSLSSIVDKSLGALQDSIDALTLPPVSEPQGNGRAYDKFLATYNSLYGVKDTATSAPSEALNTIA